MKAKLEAEAKAQAEAEVKAKLEAKAQAEADAKAKLEADAKAKVEADAKDAASESAPAAEEIAAPAPAPSGDVQIDPEPIPKKTPEGQIRRIAYIYSESQKASMEKLIEFLNSVAGTVSKKPLYLHKSVVAVIKPTTRPTDLLGHLKKTKTVGVIAILEGLSYDQAADIEGLCDDEDISYRKFSPDEVGKRTSAIELLLELMLLRAG